MRRATFTVELDGREPFTVHPDHRDVRAWKFASRPGSNLAWAADEEIVQGSWLSWNAARRTGEFDDDYEAWDAVCAAVILIDEGEEVDPTQPARSAG